MYSHLKKTTLMKLKVNFPLKVFKLCQLHGGDEKDLYFH